MVPMEVLWSVPDVPMWNVSLKTFAVRRVDNCSH
jgi:hypothetical protein